MLPVLLDLKVLKIYTFGVFLVLAFFWGAYLLWRNIRLTSYKEEDIFDGLFLSLAAGLFVGRLTYVILHFDKFGFDILKFILVNGYPGITFYGSLLGGVLGFWLYSLSHRMKLSESLDYFISPLFVALGIGKLGSFFSGAEVGAKTKFIIALKYPGFDGFRHLTALYEALLFLLGAFIAHKLMFDIRRQKLSRGFSFYFFCWFVGLVYFLLDPLKSAHLTFLSQASLNWTVSATLLLTFTVYFLYYFRNLIRSRLQTITNSSFKYGQQTYGKLHQGTGKKAKRGKGEDSQAD